MIAPEDYAAARQFMVEKICDELEKYATHRDAGRSQRAAGFAMGISRETATQYERTISNLLAVLKTETAPGATGAVESTREGATRHGKPYPASPPLAGRGRSGDRPAPAEVHGREVDRD